MVVDDTVPVFLVTSLRLPMNEHVVSPPISAALIELYASLSTFLPLNSATRTIASLSADFPTPGAPCNITLLGKSIGWPYSDGKK